MDDMRLSLWQMLKNSLLAHRVLLFLLVVSSILVIGVFTAEITYASGFGVFALPLFGYP